jgi:spermidine/putrescine-binding protein
MDELQKSFPDSVAIDARYFHVFGNVANKIDAAWKDRGGLRGYREHVQSVIREIGYVYDRSAAQLRKKRSNIVGASICDLRNPYFAEIAAGICRATRYATVNAAAQALLPPEIRRHPAIFPPESVLSRLELIQDLEEATVLYDRLWTEVKAAR